jgi:asparagine synthase (glutamine-hydrolysing)
MSVQYGRCNFDGRPVNQEDLDKVRSLLAPYGPDGEGYISKSNYSIVYRAFHTTKESRREEQPHISHSGAVITWDGRLDNREELIAELAPRLSANSTDLEIVTAAYTQRGVGVLRELIGDWSLSIWNPKKLSLILAKDFVGTRHLYYGIDKQQVTWCSILDPLVIFAPQPFKLDEEYVAGWLSFFPATQLTPYVGIQAVPPSSFVQITPGTHKITRYWDFDPANRVRYRTDSEYEEHFRDVFSDSVRRRLRSDTPILAELSGGMDSSSIVCIADRVLKRRDIDTVRLDTVSYYDDTEPNWNECPYFSKVEESRGRKGCHIKVSAQESVSLRREKHSFLSRPTTYCSADTDRQVAAILFLQGNRVVFSGIGGDEFLGGVPTATPELADLLIQCRVRTLANRLKLWALSKRVPWVHLLIEAAREFLPEGLLGLSSVNLPSWLCPDYQKRQHSALISNGRRIKVFGPLPSFQEHLKSLEGLRRQLGCVIPEPKLLYEKRYPYLDRQLLEFLFAIPQEQLVRPGQRRSLMRRALVGIVPQEILERRRKAFVSRGPLLQIAKDWPAFSEFSRHMTSSLLGIVDGNALRENIHSAVHGRDLAIVPLLRAIAFEQWLQNPDVRRWLDLGSRSGRHTTAHACSEKGADGHGDATVEQISAESNSNKKGGEHDEILEAGNHFSRSCCDSDPGRARRVEEGQFSG